MAIKILIFFWWPLHLPIASSGMDPCVSYPVALVDVPPTANTAFLKR